jgi:hypothetical protein
MNLNQKMILKKLIIDIGKMDDSFVARIQDPDSITTPYITHKICKIISSETMNSATWNTIVHPVVSSPISPPGPENNHFSGLFSIVTDPKDQPLKLSDLLAE